MRKVIQMSQRQISGNGEEKSMSLQEVFLVNHSPSQAKERERMITAISGLTCSGPYMRSGPIGSLVRTLLASSRWYSPVRRLKWEVNPLYSERVSLYLKDDSNMLLKPFAVILNAKDIPSSRYLYRLVPSVHLTDGIEFGLLPTVTAQDYKRRGPGSRQQGLPEIIHGMLLPTPVATEIHHAERVRKWKSMNLSSPHAQIAGEKNPNGLTDFLDFYGILPEPIPDNTELENTDGNNLEESILQWLAEGQVMPTPPARDWKGAPSLENLKKRGKIPQKNSLPDFFARTGKSFQLNPLFVAEMMGFPPDWTVSPFLGEDRHPLKDTGTLSSPR